MTQIMTISGTTINLAAINPGLINVSDIAYSLAYINRFNGHALRPISVAEHSLMVSEILERHFSVRDPSVLLAGLMHDAHEYLLGDVTAPVKQLMGNDWKVIEARIQRIVLLRFGLLSAFTSCKLWIHDADMHALSSEREQLMSPLGEHWDCLITHPPIDWVKYGGASQFTADDWRQMFIERFQELSFAITQRQAAIAGHGDNTESPAP
jgi:hypothetical protein